MRTEYPFISSVPRKDDYGIAIFSRIPFTDIKVHHFGDNNSPTIVAQLGLEGQILTLIAAHPPPPTTKSKIELRNRQLFEIAHFIANYSGACILIGDLNITPWSPFFRDLMDQSGLQDSRIGFGLQPSWPTTFPLLYIPIDHILVSDEINVHRRQVGPRIGSDHLPVELDFSML